MGFAIKVNGDTHSVDVDDDTPLLWVLHDGVSTVRGVLLGERCMNRHDWQTRNEREARNRMAAPTRSILDMRADQTFPRAWYGRRHPPLPSRARLSPALRSLRKRNWPLEVS
jgi:hypothetical protein